MKNLPGPTPVPDRHHAAHDLGRMVVSTSMMRKIEHELIHDECDSRTVFHSCRGLAKGSIEFEEAYVAARIRSHAKQQRISTQPFIHTPPNAGETLINSKDNSMKGSTYPAHPLAVLRLRHLMSHFGVWVIGLLGIQVFASWRISAFANAHLDSGRHLLFAIALLLFLTLNSVVWLRLRGRLCDSFLAPGAALFLMAALPVLLLYVRATVAA